MGVIDNLESVLRLLTLETSTARQVTKAIDSKGSAGVLFEVDLMAIGSTSGTPTLTITVEHSVDGRAWENSEGSVSMTSAGKLVIQRYSVYRWLRVVYQLSTTGAGPTATFSIGGNLLAEGSYATATMAFDGTPTQGQPAPFTVTTHVAGASVSWEAVYTPSGAEAGSGTAGSDGTYPGTTEVPGGAEYVTLTAQCLGQSPSVGAEVEGG